jgi:DNA-binding transcriptional ArsR family regulator
MPGSQTIARLDAVSRNQRQIDARVFRLHILRCRDIINHRNLSRLRNRGRSIRVAVASQNFRTVSGHAGTCLRFLVFEADKGTEPREVERLDLPKQLSIREFSGDGPHPLDTVRALIVGRARAGAIGRMSARKVEVVTTSESDPAAAVAKYLAGNLPPAVPADDPERAANECDTAVEFLKAMANEARLTILRTLLPGEKCVSELEQKLQLGQSRVSQELARLRRAGLVAGRHTGSSVYYRLASPHVATIIRAVYEAHCERNRTPD